MDSNLLSIAKIVDYIEMHLEDKLDLESIANEACYSKYHLHRMFTGITGFTVHSYVQRRRLTEAARFLVFTNQSIMEIALSAGYETQQSFSAAFKVMFGCSPRVLRKKGDFYPLQLKFTADGKKQLRGDMIMDIKTIESGKILLVGYIVNELSYLQYEHKLRRLRIRRKLHSQVELLKFSSYTANTKNGFGVIGECMVQLQANKEKIHSRSAGNSLIGLNDYTKSFSCENQQPAFDFYGAAEVTEFSAIPDGMTTKELPAGKYAVFSFTGNPQDSLQPAADYIYKEWFPQSTC